MKGLLAAIAIGLIFRVIRMELGELLMKNSCIYLIIIWNSRTLALKGLLSLSVVRYKVPA